MIVISEENGPTAREGPHGERAARNERRKRTHAVELGVELRAPSGAGRLRWRQTKTAS